MARHRVMELPSLLLLLHILLTIFLVVLAKEESKCLCQISGCLCCVEFNLTSSIDLGGPVCVNVRQQHSNVSINLSYADNPVHNATIALDRVIHKPTCMNLLSDLAQICAKFVSMKVPTQGKHGYDGCLVIEPALLGTPQATYPVGCFIFENGQVRQIIAPPVNLFELANGPKQDYQGDEDEDDHGLNAEELIAAVSASAEQGIALFSQWLGLNLIPRINITNENNRNDEPVKFQPSYKNSTFADLSDGRHSRTISILGESEDKNDERFKQLLSAQDNISKESAGMGEASKNLPTAFRYSLPETHEIHIPNLEEAPIISPENLVIVPSDSRRGGRAYSIHQHINEI